ncbi:caspase, EACC1-associated type [Nonomuraea sediminis]|uniref:caspase, EACC1-associated type n=1 Tax=Nonomuraea sediminis TaxID=2835864 RepID=UPI001BDC0746|nr:caspase family protein [Nonomuraea sediminis]
MSDGTVSRYALLVATDVHEDAAFTRLRTPATDAAALARILADPRIGGYDVRILHNRPAGDVRLAIEEFFADKKLDDLLMLYISGHGLKDDYGSLSFVTTDSRRKLMAATSVSAEFVRAQMQRSRSRRIVIALDCCYAGAFPLGIHHRGGESVEVLEGLSGRGRVVLTATSELEYAFEMHNRELVHVSRLAGDTTSLFSEALIEGLRSGDADADGDGRIEVRELYEYVHDRVRTNSSRQTPRMQCDIDGSIYVALAAKDTGTPIESPPVAGGRRSLRLHWAAAAVALVVATAGAISLKAFGSGVPTSPSSNPSSVSVHTSGSIPADGVIPMAKDADAHRIAAEWTSDDFRAAMPYTVPATPHISTAKEKGESRTVAPIGTPTEGLKVAPPAVGSVFFKAAGRRYRCSGASIQSKYRDVVVTAAHCLYDPITRQPHSDWVFVPGYREGQIPVGVYVGKIGHLDVRFAEQADYAFDVAFVSVFGSGNGVRLGDQVGGLGFASNQGHDATVRVFRDPDPPCSGTESAGAHGEVILGCAAGPSVGGAPLVAASDNNTAYVVGVVSFFVDSDRDGHTDHMASPYFDARIYASYNRASNLWSGGWRESKRLGD